MKPNNLSKIRKAFAAGGDAKASAGQQEVKEMFDTAGLDNYKLKAISSATTTDILKTSKDSKTKPTEFLIKAPSAVFFLIMIDNM